MENMKTIAVIESCDTKFKEAKFISDFIKNEGLNALVINTATGPAPSYNYDISREEIAESYGTPWEEMEPKSKGEKIDYMKDAVAAYVVKLYEEGKIDGINFCRRTSEHSHGGKCNAETADWFSKSYGYNCSKRNKKI